MYLSKNIRKHVSGLLLCAGAGALALPALADTSMDRASKNQKWPQATLQAEASAEVAHDTVQITLASEVSNSSQTAVADAVSKTLDEVMKQAKENTLVKARSGNYRVWPMNDKDGKISNWRGRGEIILESTDFAAASKLASTLSSRMPIAGIGFSVSPQARAKQEEALLVTSAQAFRDRSQALAEAFGFTGYTIRELDLSGSGARYESAPRMQAMMADKASVPLEGGTEMVTVSVRGSIFLLPSQK